LDVFFEDRFRKDIDLNYSAKINEVKMIPEYRAGVRSEK
jgi:hypothetical protein